MPTVKIIRATLKDAGEMVALCRETFYTAFAEKNSPENMQVYLDQAYNEVVIRRELEDQESEHYFLLEDDRKVGFLKINWGAAQSDSTDPESLELQRIYVLQEYQNRGYGSLLLRYAKHRAVELDFQHIWLGVWERNPDAIRLYERMGFVVDGSHEFVMGDEVQTDVIMRLTVNG